MAESVMEEIVPELVKNVSEVAKNATEKIPATTEGMIIAYGSLVLMALLPIFIGSYRSVKHQAASKASGEKIDTMSSKDAAMFPLIASCALFVLYIIFTNFPKEYINLLVSSYFFILGIFALTHIFTPFASKFIPSSIPVHNFHLYLAKEHEGKKEAMFDYKFNTNDVICTACCTVVATWYLLTRHWIANNLLGLAFSITGVEMLHLNNVKTGFLLLGGLFVYDIFWVFGTNVMVTVAKSFDAPIKLVFPQDLLEKGLAADNFAMLGLGDIVIPGIFIALLLRFDKTLKRGSDTYFLATFIAYFCGLMMTIGVMHIFKHAQPALLYLVPVCLGAPSLLALIKGDVSAILKYEDNESTESNTVGTKTD